MKIHATVGAAGKAMAMPLTLGQRTDIIEADSLFDEVDPKALIVDRAYDADPLIK